MNKTIKLEDWFTGTDTLRKCGFTLKEIREALKESIDFDELAGVEEYENEPTWQGTYKIVESDVWVTVIRYLDKGGLTYEARERVKGYKVLVPRKFQSLNHNKVVRYLLEKRFNWFSRLEWEIYGIDSTGENYEIYLKTSSGSVYVPVKALLAKDKRAIEKRMSDYWSWYYKNHPSKLAEELNQLNSKEATKLFTYLDN